MKLKITFNSRYDCTVPDEKSTYDLNRWMTDSSKKLVILFFPKSASDLFLLLIWGNDIKGIYIKKNLQLIRKTNLMLSNMHLIFHFTQVFPYFKRCINYKHKFSIFQKACQLKSLVIGFFFYLFSHWFS